MGDTGFDPSDLFGVSAAIPSQSARRRHPSGFPEVAKNIGWDSTATITAQPTTSIVEILVREHGRGTVIEVEVGTSVQPLAPGERLQPRRTRWHSVPHIEVWRSVRSDGAQTKKSCRTLALRGCQHPLRDLRPWQFHAVKQEN